MPRKPGTPRPSRAKPPEDHRRSIYTRDTCPNRDRFHTPMPDGLIERAERILQLVETHKQYRCPTCKLWVVWEPKLPDEPEREPDD